MGNSLRSNFGRIADQASRHGAAAMIGTVGSHFEDDVLSWHHVNGQSAEELLPAVLITTRHPHDFRLAPLSANGHPSSTDFPMILIPLKAVCKTASDVADLLERIFRDVKSGSALLDFEVAEAHRAGERAAVVDALVLRPSFAGIGVDLKKLVGLFKRKKRLP